VGYTYDQFLRWLDGDAGAVLPVGDHVACAVRHNEEVVAGLEDDEALKAGDPTRYRGRTWEFVRSVKSHGDLTPLTAAEAFARVEATLAERLGATDPWDRAFGLSRDEAQVEFYHDWRVVRMLRCRDPLTEASRLAAEHPLAPPRFGDVAMYVRFVSLAGWLQVYNGPGRTILLPVRKVGDHLGVSRQTVTKLRKWAIEDELLRVARQERFGVDRATGERFQDATEFWFAVEKYDVLVRHGGPR
jgi:hypothetical protein